MHFSVLAGFIYFLIIFAVGFILGAFRVFVTAHLVGETWAIVCELPIMLAVSWVVCRWIIRRLKVPPMLIPRLLMGLFSLTLLLTAEVVLGRVGFDLSFESQMARYNEIGPLFGLVAQIIFAIFPAAQIWVKKKTPSAASAPVA